MWIVDYWQHVDWAATGAMLQGLATAGGAIAVYIAAKIGSETFADWKERKRVERERDQAEETMRAAYRARRAMEYIRSGMMPDELAIAHAQLEASADLQWVLIPADQKDRRVRVQVHKNRLDATIPDRGALEASLPMSMALFGKDVENAIKQIASQFVLLQVHMKAFAEHNGPENAAFLVSRKMLSGVTHQLMPPDEITVGMDRAIAEIERVCIPILRMEEAKEAK
jgi:hypothetical protein